MQDVKQNIAEDVQAEAKSGRLSLRQRLAVFFTGLMVLVGGAALPASAQTTTPTDPLNGGGDQIFSTLTGYLQTHLTSLVFGLAVVSIAVGLVLRWVRKAVHA